MFDVPDYNLEPREDRRKVVTYCQSCDHELREGDIIHRLHISRSTYYDFCPDCIVDSQMEVEA